MSPAGSLVLGRGPGEAQRASDISRRGSAGRGVARPGSRTHTRAWCNYNPVQTSAAPTNDRPRQRRPRRLCELASGESAAAKRDEPLALPEGTCRGSDAIPSPDNAIIDAQQRALERWLHEVALNHPAGDCCVSSEAVLLILRRLAAAEGARSGKWEVVVARGLSRWDGDAGAIAGSCGDRAPGRGGSCASKRPSTPRSPTRAGPAGRSR